MNIIYPQLDGVKVNKDGTLPYAILQGIRKAYDYIAQLNTVSATVTGTTEVIQLPLAIALTNIDAPTTGAISLVYLLDQDATGGRTVHFRTGFAYTSDSLGGMVASTRSVLRFVRDPATGKYVQDGQPTTDMTP